MDTTGFPVDVIFIRHGQSEANFAQEHSRRGDDRYWKMLQGKHTSTYRLTDVGRDEAKVAGKWLKENIGERYDRYYCSEYIRAMETAALLGLEDCNWQTEFYLREQDQGIMSRYSYLQKKEYFGKLTENTDSFYWTSPGGESVATACLRVDRFFDNILKQCSGLRVIVVCHGNIMRAVRVRLERMSQHQFREWQDSKDIKEKIHNCQIWHYSRRNPETGHVSRRIKWRRSICPWDLSLSTNEWQSINRCRFSNEELLQYVERVPQVINSDSGSALPPLAPNMVGRAASAELFLPYFPLITNHGTGDVDHSEIVKHSGDNEEGRNHH